MAGVGLGLELVARAAWPASSARPTWLMAAGTGVFHLVALIFAYQIARAHQLSWAEAFGFFTSGWRSKWIRAAALTLPAMVGAWWIHQGCQWVLEVFSIEVNTQAAVDAVRQASRPWELASLFFFAVITAPIAEELLFRGVLWPLLRDHGWRVSGCLATSLMFAIIHFNLAALLPLWLLGIFWTWLYQRTDDLSAPILSHALFNAFNFFWLVWSAPGSR